MSNIIINNSGLLLYNDITLTTFSEDIAIDTDAQNFITTASISSTIQQNAINVLVTNLKNNNLWTKFKAFYPAVGGNATAHSYNLINTANYQLTFFGGFTHNSLGILGNGTTAYAYTNLPANTFSLNNMTAGWYNENDIANSVVGRYAIGSAHTSMQFRYFDAFNGLIQYYQGGGNNTFTNSTTQKGLYVLARQNSTQALAYKNGTLQNTATQSGITTSLSNRIIVLFATDNGSGTSTAPNANFYGAWHGNCIFFADGMSSAEVDKLSSIINTFNQMLGRNSY